MAKSKFNLTYNMNGILELDTMTITELTKEDELVYNFLEILQRFDGKEVTISIKESSELESVN